MKAFDRRGLTGQGLALDLKMEGLHFTLMSAMRLLHPMTQFTDLVIQRKKADGLRLQMMGILSIKKRHRHRLSIQSVFPGLPNTLLIRNKPPAIEKRSKVWVPSITLPLNRNWSREMNPHHIL